MLVTREINSIIEIASDYDAIVFDQWGVLHDGAKPYSFAVQTLRQLNISGHCLAVLSNSGKRASSNAQRIHSFGFEEAWFDAVMTSGEAFAAEILNKKISEQTFFAIKRTTGDADRFAAELSLRLSENIQHCDAILLRGFPDSASLHEALDRQIPVYCTNPDSKAPRSGGIQVIQPGALAFDYEEKGGRVTFYGKPHRPIFENLKLMLGAERLLMVGDSLENDIAGGYEAGWDTLLVKCGLHSKRFSKGDTQKNLKELTSELSTPNPTFIIEQVK